MLVDEMLNQAHRIRFNPREYHTVQYRAGARVIPDDSVSAMNGYNTTLLVCECRARSCLSTYNILYGEEQQ